VNRLKLLLIAVAACAFGQTGSPALTLEDCIRLALAAPSAATSARIQTEIARYGATQARTNFLPQFLVGGAYAYNSPLPGTKDQFSFVALNGIREYTLQPTSNLELDTAGRLRAIRARAEADQQAAAANLGIAQRDLKHTVTASYYRLLLTRRLVKVAEETLAEAQVFDKRTRLLFDNGEVARADVAKSAAQVSFLEQTLQAAQLDARLANHELASFWTVDVETTLNIVDTLEETPVAPEAYTVGDSPFLKRPEFQVYNAQRLGFLADRRRARADLLPQVGLTFQWGIDSTRFNFKEDRGYAGFLHLNVPVFDWFRTRSAMRQFQLQAEQVDSTREASLRTFSKDYRDALARVDLIYSQIARTEEQVKLSEENLNLSRVRYEGGEGSSLDVVSSQSQLAQAKANYYTARANYLTARADLEVAKGQ
jgi:outer membrane protein